MMIADKNKNTIQRDEEQAALCRAAEEFGFDLTGTAPSAYGEGLIHSSWRLETTQGPHLFQRLNDQVFPNPVAVAENAAAAAARVDDALDHIGDHDPRHRLSFVKGPSGRPWLRDKAGAVWRAAVLITDSRPADPKSPQEVRTAAAALGRFPGLVASGSGPEPIEVLPGFHDVTARLAAFQTAAHADNQDRLAACRVEVEVLRGQLSRVSRLHNESLPIRLVHNDAKLDNVLVDKASGEALCVIDLDTVMPGFCIHDFGDLVRSAVTGCPEDEAELDRIHIRESTFRDLCTGYLEGASGWIGDHERSCLLDGAILITFEQALRFVTDYLKGDPYYPVNDGEHNLRRTRAQIALLEELVELENDLRKIINDI